MVPQTSTILTVHVVYHVKIRITGGLLVEVRERSQCNQPWMFMEDVMALDYQIKLQIPPQEDQR